MNKSEKLRESKLSAPSFVERELNEEFIKTKL